MTNSDSPTGRLDSWKDIAAYLKRDVSTVQRWEKREGMPVHRHVHDKLGSVYAFQSELDAWARGRRLRSPTAEPVGPEVPSTAPETTTRSRRSTIILAVALALATTAAIIVAVVRLNPSSDDPMATARFVHLTDFNAAEHSAVISNDGRFAAFLSDHDGPVDVWVTQIGTGRFQNLTGGKLGELVNPDIRVLGFSPDGTLVTFWLRRASKPQSPDISIWSVPTLGGEPRIYLEGAAEYAWSSDGKRLLFHTPAPGDPMYMRDENGERKLFGSPAGVHNHYPVWSPDDELIYFVNGTVPVEQDIWRIRAEGGTAERMTSHDTRVSHLTFAGARTLLYLATEKDGAGPWLYALDVATRQSRRVSSGVERYASLAGTGDGRRLVATVVSSKRTLWRVPIGDGIAEPAAASRVSVAVVGGRSPRRGPDYLLYVSARRDAESIWKLAGATASELWTATAGRVIGGPAISRDGKRIAFTAEERGKMRTYVMSEDGTGLRVMPEALEPRSAPAWSPDGGSIALAAMVSGRQRLVKVSLADQTVTPIGADFAAEPSWSAEGAILFSGPEVGTTFPITAVTSDGRRQAAPPITLSRGVRRIAFLPDQNAIVVLRGEMIHKNFWAIDLATGRERLLTNFGPDFIIGDFDVSPDGREIVFDREQDSSDVVLVER